MNAALMIGVLFAANPPVLMMVDHVDAIEIHHRVSDTHTVSWTQVIFWGRDARVIDWTWDYSGKSSMPRPTYYRGQWQVTWITPYGIRRVYARAFIETWSTNDPEFDDTEIMERKHRKGLSKWGRIMRMETGT